MVKKVIIEISLVEESAEKANKEIEKEIFNDLSEGIPVIPWCKKVEKVHCDRGLENILSTANTDFHEPLNFFL